MRSAGRPSHRHCRGLLVAAALIVPACSNDAHDGAAGATEPGPTVVATSASVPITEPATTSTSSTTTATAATTPRTPLDRLVLLGDSLGEEIEGTLASMIGAMQFVPLTLGGTSACDWFTDDLQPSPTTVIVMTFHGNALSPCTEDAAGNALRGDVLVEKYRVDLGVLIDRALAAGAHVLLVGQPVDRRLDDGTFGVVPALNEMYRRLAAERGVAYVAAGQVVEAADGTFTDRLPCLPGEPQCGADGINVVRNDDGVHLCPGPHPVAPCAVYSSGAYRFAKAIATAVTGL